MTPASLSFTDMIAEERRARTESLAPDERLKLEGKFVEATWRGTSRHPLTGRPVLQFDTKDGPVRFHLSWSHAYEIVSSGIECWFYFTLTNRHSVNSSGNPQFAGLPEDGQAPVPETKSSSACSGVQYESSASSSKNVTQRSLLGLIANVPRRLLNSQYPFIRFSIGCLPVPMVNAAGRAFKAARSLAVTMLHLSGLRVLEGEK